MKKFLLTLLLTLSSAVAFAISGSGTSSDPYIVKTADDLYQMRSYPNAYYKLGNNINLAQWINDNYPSQGWVPICTESSPFNGTLDGNGYTISNLYINRSSQSDIGLIGYASGATIKNLNVKCDISGGNNTGAIIGRGFSITLSNCYAEGQTQGTTTGGLVGYASTISATNCTFIGRVNGTSTTGGIVGWSGKVTLTQCAVEGEIHGGSWCGGIVGIIARTTVSSEGKFCFNHVNKCYAKANISSTGSHVGGIVGYDISSYTYYSYYYTGYVTGDVSDCFFDGNIKADYDYVGGIAGYASGEYKRCYAKGTVTGNSYVGGIAGYLYGSCSENSSSTITKAIIYSCVSLCTSIKSNDDLVSRICNAVDYYTLGTFGANTENKVCTDCRLYKGENTTIFPADNQSQGYAVVFTALQRSSAYTALTWDFSSVWNIVEGDGYPYLRFRKPSENSIDKEEKSTFNFTSPTTLSPSITPSGEEDTGVNVTDKTFRNGDISVAFGLGSRTQSFSARIWTNDNLSKTLRVYQNGTMTISTTDNNLITKITFNGDDISMMSANTGTISGGAWAGSANKVTFTIGASMNKINSITVTYKRDKMPLTDSAPTLLAGTYGSGKISYSRYASGDYASFCFPFDINLASATGIEKVYMPMDQILYNTQTEYLMMFLKEQSMSSTIKAGTPFLAKISDANVSFINTGSVTYNSNVTSNPTAKALTVFDFDGKSGVLYQNNTLDVTWGGTYVATAATTGLNSFNINGSFGQHSGTLSPYRAYVMQTAKSGANSNVRGIQLNLGDDEGEVTSIFQLLNAPAATESIYDMQGRRVLNPQQGGLYIINGKKVRL